MRLCLIILYYLMYAYLLFISINILISWIPPLYNSRIFTFTRKISNWYMGPFHGLIVIGFIDFSPILGFIIYEFIMNCLSMLIG